VSEHVPPQTQKESYVAVLVNNFKSHPAANILNLKNPFFLGQSCEHGVSLLSNSPVVLPKHIAQRSDLISPQFFGNVHLA
jgi:hypothetical protein